MRSRATRRRRGTASAALAATAALLATGCVKPEPSGSDPANLEPSALINQLMAATDDVVVVDLRSAEQFAAFHLPGAVLLSATDMCGQPGKQLLADEPRLLVLCGPGNECRNVQATLSAAGHDRVRVLKSEVAGVRKAWLEARDGPAPSLLALQRAFLLGSETMAPEGRYATDPQQLDRPTMVSTQWLQDRLAEVAVLDVRKQLDHATLHIPGSRHLEPGSLRQRSGDRLLDLVAREELARRFGSLGIDRETTVVVVAQSRMLDATLVATALLHLGHQKVALLEGGLLCWAAERRQLVGTPTTIAAKTYETRSRQFSMTTDAVASGVEANSVQVLDVRPAAYFRGDRKAAARAGHIPGSRNRFFGDDLNSSPTGQWLLPREQLLAGYDALDLAPGKPIVVSCRTGHSASQTFFVLSCLLGYRDVRWYNGSWTEWASRPELPVATGER